MLVFAAPAGAYDPKVEVTLVPAADQAGASGPYRLADMTLVNHSRQMLRQVRLRWTEGGPTMIHPMTLAPAERQTIPVLLPAGSQVQTYRAGFTGDPKLAPAEATITWPIEQITRDELISPTDYDRYGGPQPLWSAPLRWNILLGALIAALGAAATLFVRRRAVRLGAVLGVMVLACGAGAIALAGQDVLVESEPVAENPAGPDAVGERILYVVSARRTARWRHPDGTLAPVYADESQMDAETMTLHPHDGAAVEIAPGEVRLFRTTTGR